MLVDAVYKKNVVMLLAKWSFKFDITNFKINLLWPSVGFANNHELLFVDPEDRTIL